MCQNAQMTREILQSTHVFRRVAQSSTKTMYSFVLCSARVIEKTSACDQQLCGWHRWVQRGERTGKGGDREGVCFFLGIKEDPEWTVFPPKFPKSEGEFYCGWVIRHLRRQSKLSLGPCLVFPTLQLSCAVLKSAGFIYGLPAATSSLPFILLSAGEMGTVCSVSLFCYPNTRERGSQYPLVPTRQVTWNNMCQGHGMTLKRGLVPTWQMGKLNIRDLKCIAQFSYD